MAAKRRSRAAAAAAILGRLRLWALALAAAICVGAPASAAQGCVLDAAAAAENSPLGLARNLAAISAGAERSQAVRSPLESGHAYGQLASDVPYATRGAETVGPRLLSAIPSRVTNGANHIFGPNSLAKHKLEGVLNTFKGDATAAFYSLENAAQALANQGAIKGVFQTTVQVAGSNVTVRGAVIDGAARISTAFIP